MINDKKFLKIFKDLSDGKDEHKVFSDLIKMFGYSLLAVAEKDKHDYYDNKYLEIVKDYTREEVQEFAKLTAQIILMLENNMYTDVLGNLYMKLKLNSKEKHQYFTPSHIADFMAEISLEDIEKPIKEKGYLTLAEPTCGSGSLIYAAMRVMLKKGYNPQEHLVVHAQDIDLICALMTYIQLTLLNIKAVVTCGDTLSDSSNNIDFHTMQLTKCS